MVKRNFTGSSHPIQSTHHPPAMDNIQSKLELHSFIETARHARAETDFGTWNFEQDTLIVFVIWLMFDLFVGGMGL